jgi:hypothetical protein
MPLYDRLLGYSGTKIRVHAFMGALGERARGKLTDQQVINAFTLDVGEQAELATLLGKVVVPPESISLGGYLTLTNVGATYDAIAASKGLGHVRVETAGINAVELLVRYDKVGTGTLTFQLWNETTGLEVGALNDAAAAGNGKVLSGVVDFTPPLGPGTADLRVRCKSTVAADDPNYYGSSLRVRRVDLLGAEVIHQILLMGESRVPPYDSVAAVTTRLGV